VLGEREEKCKLAFFVKTFSTLAVSLFLVRLFSDMGIIFLEYFFNTANTSSNSGTLLLHHWQYYINIGTELDRHKALEKQSSIGTEIYRNRCSEKQSLMGIELDRNRAL